MKRLVVHFLLVGTLIGIGLLVLMGMAKWAALMWFALFGY